MSDFDKMNEGLRWYVAHTYSGYENKVKTNLEKIVENRGLQHLIDEIRIPTETVVETDGSKDAPKEVESKIFPSYVLIKMVMTDETWHIVRNIRGVTGFVGPGSKPVPLSEDEVLAMGMEKKQIKVDYKVDDTVVIVAGSLADTVGVVDEIDLEKNNVRVIISMFGRDTPVDLELDQVEPLE